MKSMKKILPGFKSEIQIREKYTPAKIYCHTVGIIIITSGNHRLESAGLDAVKGR